MAEDKVLDSPPRQRAPTPDATQEHHATKHRAGSLPYAGMTGAEDLKTLWQTSNVFFYCLSVRLDGARGLPSSSEIFCEVQGGPRVRLMPLLLSQADLQAGGGGRVDGGRLSERLDILLDEMPEELEVRLVIKAHGPMWTQRTEKLSGQLALAERWSEPTTPIAVPSEWLPMTHPEATKMRARGSIGGSAGADGVRGGGIADRGSDADDDEAHVANGPALLVRVQCFERADLADASVRAKLFDLYSENGSSLTAAEFDALLLDVSSGRRLASGELDLAAVGAAASRGRPRGVWRACLGHIFAAFGLYKPRVPLFSYLMYYHTLLWVVCRAPGEEHIPICHRLSFVLLSLGFNLFVVVLFTATDCSLLSIYCPSPADAAGDECSDLARSVWDSLQILLVAVIDSTFWPVLKALFYMVEDLWSGRSQCGVMGGAVWRLMRVVLVGLFSTLLIWMSISAAKHVGQLGDVLHEFLTTWPAARVTETFKLMSMWALLVEYGQPEPPHAASARHARQDGGGRAITAPAADGGTEHDQIDSKRVPLLSDQR